MTAQQLQDAVMQRTLKALVSETASTTKKAIQYLEFNPVFIEIRNKYKLTPDNVIKHESYAPSQWELRQLAEIVKINVMVFMRESPRTPDRLFCAGKVPNREAMVMFKLSNLKNKDHLELIVKHGTKFLIELSDFTDPKWQDTLKKKMKSYTV
jgi:hypothetical protein